MKKWFFFPLLTALLLSGCAPTAPQEQGSSTTYIAMNTEIKLTVFGENSEEEQQALANAVAEINRLDKLLSRHNEDSAISAINHSSGAPVEADEEVITLLKKGVQYSKDTNGALDITVAPIMDAWNFTGAHPRVPSREELDKLLLHVGDERIAFGNGTVTLEDGMAIDLGGIAKGYASDCLSQVLNTSGIDSAMVSLGGNVYVHGTKPDGSLWRIAVEDPNNSGSYFGILNVADKFAITSGGYQRYFEENGTTYYHIIDPKTGDVARNGLVSVTVVCDNGTMGDALSTALFVMGYDAAVEFWKNYETEFDMILMDDTGHVYLTEGLKDCFEPSSTEQNYEYTFLSKT